MLFIFNLNGFLIDLLISLASKLIVRPKIYIVIVARDVAKVVADWLISVYANLTAFTLHRQKPAISKKSFSVRKSNSPSSKLVNCAF